jgi:hypothetical protein|tara:strand:- start:492 stop:656 length:165 start_codon:yes stop_codon:yes gene_type:complete
MAEEKMDREIEFDPHDPLGWEVEKALNGDPIVREIPNSKRKKKAFALRNCIRKR